MLGSEKAIRRPHAIVVTLDFPPDNVSTGHLAADVACHLVENGYSVTVLTTRPHAKPDPDIERHQPLKTVVPWLLWRSSFDGVRVLHAATLTKSASRLRRTTGWLLFHAVSTLAGLFAARRTSLVLALSPPLTNGLSAWLMARRYRCQFVYYVLELYPDVVVHLGLIREGWLFHLLQRMEKFIYRKAALVVASTPTIYERLGERGLDPDRRLYLPHWVDTDEVKPIHKVNPFSLEHNLADSFVVSYAGNIGLAQGLDYVLDSAARVTSESDITFLIVGYGVAKEQLMRKAAELTLTNVRFLPPQPIDLVPQIYASSDVSLVTLLPAIGSDVIPSKVVRIMAAATPVIAVTRADSDLAELVVRAECGIVVEPGDPEALADAVQDLAGDGALTQKLGEAGRQYAIEHFSEGVVLDRLKKGLDRVTDPSALTRGTEQ